MTGPARAEQADAVTFACQNGLNFFDTAPGYGDGTSEANLGAVLASTGADAIVSTKVRLREGQLGSIKKSVQQSVHDSLARLQRQSVDFVILHNRIDTDPGKVHLHDGHGLRLSPEDLTGRDGVLEAFSELKRDGKVRFTGFTTLDCDPGGALLAAQTGEFDVLNCAVNATVFADPAEREHLESLLAAAAELGMGVMAIRVLLNALESRPTGPRPATEAETREVVGQAIRFALGVDGVTSAILGFSTVQHVAEAVAAVSGES